MRNEREFVDSQMVYGTQVWGEIALEEKAFDNEADGRKHLKELLKLAKKEGFQLVKVDEDEYMDEAAGICLRFVSYEKRGE